MIINFQRWVESIEMEGEAGIKMEQKYDERFGRLFIKLSRDKNENKNNSGKSDKG